MIRCPRVARRGSRGSILDSRKWRQSRCHGQSPPNPRSVADRLGGCSAVDEFHPPTACWSRARPGRRVSYQDIDSWLHKAFIFNYTTNSKDRTREDAKPSTVGDQRNQNGPQDRNEEASSAIYDHWSKQLTSVPNLITLSRIASAPLLSYLIVSQHHEMALVGCLISGASDVLDGYLAKQHNMATVLGTYLDPLADKVIINVLSVSLCYTGTLPTPLVALWLVRDAGLTIGTYFYVARNTSSGQAVMDPWTTPLKVNPTVTSKVNTALQFATLSFAILAPLYPGLEMALTTLCWGTGLTTVASGFSYLGYSAFSASGNQSHSSDEDDAHPPAKP